jgi:hypothetical protein
MASSIGAALSGLIVQDADRLGWRPIQMAGGPEVLVRGRLFRHAD